jgi:GNAT superfamily N-acetyltransferase
MKNISIVNREMTSAEFARMNTGFDEHSIENNVAIQRSKRFGFVGLDDDKFIGCSSGLAHKNGDEYTGWFFLTDLFVEKEYRSNGLGTNLLKSIEEEVANIGVKHIYLWTSGDEALRFYHRYDYFKFAEMEHWYSDGSSRVGLRKNL